jgi:NAD(P)-dependent dehydrogenase (short-subunit alcohol dehydrogenase family)
MNYNIEGKVAVLTGAGGAICGEIAKSLALEGASVAIWDISQQAALKKSKEIGIAGGSAIAIECDATDKSDVSSATSKTIADFGTIDILVNGAGGGHQKATTSIEREFFDLKQDDMNNLISCNYTSTLIPSQVVGRIFADKKSGVILNITSIAGILPLTRAISYSNAKAAVNSLTQWLAVHMAQNYSPRIRVNGIAPGFILTAQNEFLLIDEKSGQITDRGKQIMKHVPMARYGKPSEIVGASLWLVSDLASFVTGAIIPVDGGYTAFSGV